MGILPIQFRAGDTASTLGLTGRESFAIRGIANGVEPKQEVTVEARREDGSTFAFTALARIDGPADAATYRAGGILPLVLRPLIAHA